MAKNVPPKRDINAEIVREVLDKLFEQDGKACPDVPGLVLAGMMLVFLGMFVAKHFVEASFTPWVQENGDVCQVWHEDDLEFQKVVRGAGLGPSPQTSEIKKVRVCDVWRKP